MTTIPTYLADQADLYSQDPRAAALEWFREAPDPELLRVREAEQALEFFSTYANEFADKQQIGEGTRQRLPNLMLLGYLLRVVEERVLGEDAEE